MENTSSEHPTDQPRADLDSNVTAFMVFVRWLLIAFFVLSVISVIVYLYSSQQERNSQQVIASSLDVGFEKLNTVLAASFDKFAANLPKVSNEKLDKVVGEQASLAKSLDLDREYIKALTASQSAVEIRLSELEKSLACHEKKISEVERSGWKDVRGIEENIDKIRQQLEELKKLPPPVLADVASAVQLSQSGLLGSAVVTINDPVGWVSNYYGIGQKSKSYSRKMLENGSVRLKYQSVPNWESRVYVVINPENRWLNEKVLLSTIIADGRLFIANDDVVALTGGSNIQSVSFGIYGLQTGEKSDHSTICVYTKPTKAK